MSTLLGLFEKVFSWYLSIYLSPSLLVIHSKKLFGYGFGFYSEFSLKPSYLRIYPTDALFIIARFVELPTKKGFQEGIVKGKCLFYHN